MKRKKWIKAPSSALLDKIYKEALRACSNSRQGRTGDKLHSFLRLVHLEYVKRLDAAGIYVEHAGMPHTKTEEWKQRDRADEMREVSWLVAARKIA